MPISSPPVDPRALVDVVRDTASLVRAYSAWRPRPDGAPDAGSALIQIFGAMAAQVIARINKIPDRSFLAFLGMLGFSQRPPRAARVPLTFTLAPGAPAAARVPRGTLVGATPAPGDTEDVVFETELDLETTPAVLAAAFVRQPDGDLYTDVSDRAAQGGDPYAVFMGEGAMEHVLYLAADEVLSLPAQTGGTADVDVLFSFASADDASAWQAMNVADGEVELAHWSYYDTFDPLPPVVVWELWDGEGWSELTITSAVDGSNPASWRMSASLLGEANVTSVNGRPARWFRARLTARPASVPEIQGITVSATDVATTAAAPDAAFFDALPIDLGKDFYPLGQQPVFSDAFYLGSQTVLAHAGAHATVTVSVVVSDGYAGRDGDCPTVAWEIWTGDAWEEIGRSGWNEDGDVLTSTSVDDGSQALTQNGDVVLTLAQAIAPCAVQGITSYWLRARLVQRGYGAGIGVSTDGTSVVDDGYRPPVLKSVTLSCTSSPSVTPDCLTYDDHAYCVQVGAFTPFALADDRQPALYLGFDRAFGDQSVALYVQVTPLSFAGMTRAEIQAAAADTDASPEVAWEYWNGTSWALLGADDGTRRFALSGLVRFLGPLDFAPRVELGESLYWIRARLDAGSYAVPPRAGRVLTNTAMGVHATTVTGEVLGSSNHAPRQTFSLSQAPVLDGQQIEVMEVAAPSPDALASLRQQAGDHRVIVTQGSDGSTEEAWVVWAQVPNFDLSGAGDRHYVLDSATGVVRFGDGAHGKVPPAGSGNIRAAWYRAGGGAAGDRPVDVVNQMKTAVTYVTAVTNHEAATGGADTESLAHLVERGPRVLRHRQRAVAAADFEDLTQEASAAVARVTAVTPVFDPSDESSVKGAGHVLVVLVPQGSDPRPSPGLGLLQEVGAYLRARSAPAARLSLSGPSWIAASVTDVSVVPRAMAKAETLQADIVATLDAFFHPLTGNFDGRGWQFAELPRTSDVGRLVASMPGVLAVKSLSLDLAPVDPSLFGGVESIPETTVDASLNGALICSGSHHVRIVPQD